MSFFRSYSLTRTQSQTQTQSQTKFHMAPNNDEKLLMKYCTQLTIESFFFSLVVRHLSSKLNDVYVREFNKFNWKDT